MRGCECLPQAPPDTRYTGNSETCRWSENGSGRSCRQRSWSWATHQSSWSTCSASHCHPGWAGWWARWAPVDKLPFSLSVWRSCDDRAGKSKSNTINQIPKMQRLVSELEITTNKILKTWVDYCDTFLGALSSLNISGGKLWVNCFGGS